MTLERTRQLLLAGTAGAICLLTATPAAAQAAGPKAPAPKKAVARPAPAEDRLVPLAAVQARRAGEGRIRPFGGDILPKAGRIRTFAGEVVGTKGRIRALEGEAGASAEQLQASAGRIRALAGRIRALSHDVSAETVDTGFWGTLTPRGGTLSASKGRIRALDGDFEAMKGRIRALAGRIRALSGTLPGYEEASVAYDDLNGGFRELVDQTKAAWGETVQQQTGQAFEDAFSNRMLAKYGIDLNDPRALAGLNEVDVELFLLDWNDNLMLYSGQDQVDHWMAPVNWSPALTQSLGNGADTKIGILDYAITGDEHGNVSKAGGYAGVEDNHGSAVSSLIVAKHDGRGVMGIAPNAQVMNYNPFDATNTAGWADIKSGVRFLLANGSSVINASLGVPGHTLHSGWNDVFSDSWTSTEAKKRVFVLAAGNEGATQTQNVYWNFFTNPNIIVVGSVDPDGTISEFSNRPGEACLTSFFGFCASAANKLKNRFIVAPGEFMLVSDGQGAVTRLSGTSFAAPLVSGTIALIHDRWPWLASKPKDTVDIILNSARDIGTPGTDGVYGRGMLDVQAALSPLNWNRLEWRFSANGSSPQKSSASSILNTSTRTRSTWEASKVYFTVFEDTGDSYRDFAIPMSSKLLGQTVGNTGEQFNAYLQSRFWSWFNANQGCDDCGDDDDDDDDDGDDFTHRYMTARIANVAGMRATAIASPRTWRPGLRQSTVPFDTGLALRSGDGRLGLSFGSGEGAAITGQRGFGLASDYDAATGGANPYLGLASGSGYAAAELRIGERFTVSTGVSRQDARMDLDRMTLQDRQVLGSVDPYRATANTLTVQYRASGKLTANLGYTLLSENSALLGVRSLNPYDLRNGSATDAATLGADYAVANGLKVSMTGTLGRTRPGDGSQGVAVAGGGLISSAWQMAVAKDGLFDGNDSVRVTLAQPLHVEAGRIGFTGVEVVDRRTGELGDVTRFADFDGGRCRFVAEAMYGRTLADGAAQLSMFGRADLGARDRTQGALTLGGSFRLGF